MNKEQRFKRSAIIVKNLKDASQTLLLLQVTVTDTETDTDAETDTELY